jgi:hypothetical protein
MRMLEHHGGVTTTVHHSTHNLKTTYGTWKERPERAGVLQENLTHLLIPGGNHAAVNFLSIEVNEEKRMGSGDGSLRAVADVT